MDQFTTEKSSLKELLLLFEFQMEDTLRGQLHISARGEMRWVHQTGTPIQLPV